ncbi:hypothetical protein DSO57_1011656 [Entomophthora muscae]|uniref:Uncharacterized protein n=1 Tax=Entomophthora muscae TaxID=34485 RepID=A0ACC2S8B1_9FUNG|nr:hypothetical protein DSO57_1011656 [Entomophthora muscae]
MLEIPPNPPLSTVSPAQDFILGMTNQAVSHTGNWKSLATVVNYLARIVHIVFLAFQAQPASPTGVQPDSGMGHDLKEEINRSHRATGSSFPQPSSSVT